MDAVPSRPPGEHPSTKTSPRAVVINVSHEGSPLPAADEPASPALTDGPISPSRRTGAFSIVRQQSEASALKEAEAIAQQQLLMQETREALARLSQVSSAFSALESEMVSRPVQDGDPEGNADGNESPPSILTPRKDDDEYKPTSREIIRDLEDERQSKSAIRTEILEDLQGWALRALAKDEDISGANFEENPDDDDDNQGVEEEDEDIPCKTCGKSNGMIHQIEEVFEARARALRENLKAANEADLKQRMQQREEEMERETRARVEAAVQDAVKASIKEKADLGEQIATLQSALKKQGRGSSLDGGPMKLKITELEGKIHDLERSLKDSADEKDMYKKEADALKRKDQARTMAMQAQNLHAKSGEKSLKDQLAEAEEKIHSIHQELNLQIMKSLELEQAKLELDQELAAERKVLKRTEEKCGSLEEQLLQERAKTSAHARDKLSSGDGTDGGRSTGGTVKVVAGKVADIRQKDKSINDLNSKLQEMDKQFSAMNTKMEEKDVEMKKQVGTMIKMDTDVERLVAAINHARETLVADIRASLQTLFETARAEEAALLDTVVRENKFFQSRIGRQLLEPRVSQLEGPLMESLNLPVYLRMETAYTFPSVPREEISERLDGFARVSGTQVVPGAPVPPSRLVMSTPEGNDGRLIHWQAPAVTLDEAADADYLASLNWDACQDRDWVTWVTPTKQTPAVAMLAGAGPSRVTFNAPTEVMMSQNQQTRRYEEFLSLERLPAHPVATELSGPTQRQRHWSPSRGRPTSAPMHDRHQAASVQKSSNFQPTAHRTFTATPHKGSALPGRRIPLEMALEQETAENTIPQIPQPAPTPNFAIEPIPLYEDRELMATDGTHPQFYRVAGIPADGQSREPGSMRPVSAGPHSTFDNRQGHAYPPLHPHSPRGSRGAADAGRQLSPLRGSQQHFQLSPRQQGQQQGHLPPLTIPGEDSIGYKISPGLAAQTSSTSQYVGESSQEAPADFYGLGLVPSGVSVGADEAVTPRGQAGYGGDGGRAKLLPGGDSRPCGGSILQRKHDVASHHALQTSGGDPQVLQQKLVNAVQESREKWNQERKLRLQLESRIKELEASAPQVQKSGNSSSGTRPVSASRGSMGGLSRPQSAGGSIKANAQIQFAAGTAMERAGSYDGAMSVGGWSDVSNEYSMSLPRIDSSEGLLSGEASKVTEGY